MDQPTITDLFLEQIKQPTAVHSIVPPSHASKLSQLVSRLREGRERQLIHVGTSKGDEDKLLLLGFLFILRRELSNMPAAHMAELLFRQQSQTILVLEGDKVTGGLCFSILKPAHSCELTLMAVEGSRQGKGIGVHLMNEFKGKVQEQGFNLVVTCADNRALEFYLKQGFIFKTSAPLGVSESSLEHYTNSTFMYLTVDPQIDYEIERDFYKRQREVIVRELKEKLCHPINSVKGLPSSQSKQSKNNQSYRRVGTLLSEITSRAEPEILEFPQKFARLQFLLFNRPIDLRAVNEAYRACREEQVEDILMLLVSFFHNAWSFYRGNDRLRVNIQKLQGLMEEFLTVE